MQARTPFEDEDKETERLEVQQDIALFLATIFFSGQNRDISLAYLVLIADQQKCYTPRHVNAHFGD